jgi:hypothetical protein
MMKILVSIAAVILLGGDSALAQNSFLTPGGSNAPGAVAMCANASGQMVPCGLGAPISTTTNPIHETPQNFSGTITTGGQWQVIMPSNANRRAFRIQNPCSATMQAIATAENLFIEFNTVAPVGTIGHFELVPCGMLESGTDIVGTNEVWALGATTGHAFTAREWGPP